MGLCHSDETTVQNDPDPDNSSSSWVETSWVEDCDGDSSSHEPSLAWPVIVKPGSHFQLAMPIMVTGMSNKNASGGIGISQLIFSSDKLLALEKPLFSRCSSRTLTSNVSSSTFFPDATAGHSVSVTQVTSQLFFGSWEDAQKDDDLRYLGISHILSLIGPKNPVKGLKHEHKPMNDYGRTNLKKLLKKIWAFVQDSQQPGNILFVHCLSGQNRSATVVIAILMNLGRGAEKHPITLIEAYRAVKLRRPMVQINEHYAKQLSDLEYELFGKISVPKDWMKIRSADLDTGNVIFCGEGITQRYTPAEAQAKGLTVEDKLSYHKISLSKHNTSESMKQRLTDLASQDYCFKRPEDHIPMEQTSYSEGCGNEILFIGHETTVKEDQLPNAETDV